MSEGLLFEGPDWNFDLLKRAYDEVARIGTEELGLELYRNQIEVITAEQMLDAYAASGMPLMYRHWSFGKSFARQEMLYRKGLRGLALEIVINSNPSICYIMEENTMTMQTTVLAHAAVGHNSFFRANQAFRDWTDADAILDYLSFARNYVAECEERHGLAAVERTLDAAHALGDQGVDRYGRRARPHIRKERERALARHEDERRSYNDLWRTLPQKRAADPDEATADLDEQAARRALGLPEENLLYFLEKHSPVLKDWQRELLRIVRNVMSYFEPQRQTKVMNEGCACWVHHHIMTRLRDRGRITDGSMLEFLHMHAQVVAQPGFDDRRFSGINPYALGFAMMRDIERICTEPTDEDREWFPQIAGNGKPVETLRHAWAEFRDESFILQYLSPHLMREMRMFRLHDSSGAPDVVVEAIHDERGYKKIRKQLAAMYDPSLGVPRIEIADADLRGSRKLLVHHSVRNGRVLDALEGRRVLRHVHALWGYPVVLHEIADDSGDVVAEHAFEG